MAFIFLKTDAFVNVIQQTNAWQKQGTSQEDLAKLANKVPVRRPYRGIQIKEDTYSTISIRRSDNSVIKLVSSSDTDTSQSPGSKSMGSVDEYADYILQSIQEQRMEKQQIIETFGDPYVYFFGERPRIIQFSGQLISTEDFNWRSQFWKNYDENIRGTKLVQQNARAYVSFDTIVVEGYVLNASAVDTADNPYVIPFNFSMLVTNYFDWSNIGQRSFPGDASKLKSVEILNQELESSRGTFLSTGEEVRYRNLTAAGSSGILATIRKGIRAINEAVSMVGGLTDKIHNVIGGRNVRLPIGVAGYLQSTGAATIASGSIGGEFYNSVYDSATGTYKNLKGSVKLRMPGVSKFAPSWVSEYTKKPIGYIFENYDEYPLRSSPQTLLKMLSLKDYGELVDRKIQRSLAVEENDLNLAIWNMQAEAGSFLGSLADAVNFVKSNFGMIMSTLAFVRDPSTVLKQSLGIGVGTTSKSRIAGRVDELSRAGIKTSAQEEANRSLLERAGKWIGGSALNTFKNVATAKEEDPTPSSLGEVYSQNPYQSSGLTALPGPGDANYEAAYGDKDYTSLARDPDAQSTLDEVYGNTDSASGSDITPSSLEEVYGTGSSSSSVRSPEDIAAALQQAQSNNVENDEDTTGITGEDDAGAQIDPII